MSRHRPSLGDRRKRSADIEAAATLAPRHCVHPGGDEASRHASAWVAMGAGSPLVDLDPGAMSREHEQAQFA